LPLSRKIRHFSCPKLPSNPGCWAKEPTTSWSGAGSDVCLLSSAGQWVGRMRHLVLSRSCYTAVTFNSTRTF